MVDMHVCNQSGSVLKGLQRKRLCVFTNEQEGGGYCGEEPARIPRGRCEDQLVLHLLPLSWCFSGEPPGPWPPLFCTMMFSENPLDSLPCLTQVTIKSEMSKQTY